MLKALHIRNVVLIDQLTLDFKSGLSALTGETGAGKSILLDSLGLTLGSRADTGLVRHGTEQASVSASFEISPQHPAYDLLKEQGIEASDDLILRRTVSADGKSRAFVNDEPVSVGFLKTLGEFLVDVHGQFETYGLLNPQTHGQVLDEYAGSAKYLSVVSQTYRAWQEKDRALVKAREDAAAAKANEEWLRAVVDEIQKLSPLPGEEAEILGLRQKTQNREAIAEALKGAVKALEGKDSAEAMVGQAWKYLERASDKIGDEVSPILETLNTASMSLQEGLRQIQKLMASFDEPAHNVETLDDRLYDLRAAARKHHCSVDDLAAKGEELSGQLKLIDHQDHVMADLEKQVKAARADYDAAAKKLHDVRAKAAEKLDKLVNQELAPLKLEKAKFTTSVQVLPEANWNSNGSDDIKFLVSTNRGAAPGALNKVASGGEMARFMLALKVVLAESAAISGVYVFDEIDTGIGGATASAVGERLARLSERHQVLVVTHSPQVAARANNHWVVSKANANTNVQTLKPKDRQEEIARMLSGAEITTEARAAAGKLLEASAA